MNEQFDTNINDGDEESEEMKQAIRQYGLRSDISRIHKSMMQEMDKQRQPVVRSIPFYISRVAASLLLLLAGISLYLYFSSTTDSLFNNKYIVYQQSTQRSGDNANANRATELFSLGIGQLNAAKYPEAVRNFSALLAYNQQHHSRTLQDDAEYYLALAYLKNQQPQQAYDLFSSIHKNTNHLYNDQVGSWFLLKLKVLVLKNRR